MTICWNVFKEVKTGPLRVPSTGGSCLMLTQPWRNRVGGGKGGGRGGRGE